MWSANVMHSRHCIPDTRVRSAAPILFSPAGGDEAEVRRLVEAARQDYRDVLWWADEA